MRTTRTSYFYFNLLTIMCIYTPTCAPTCAHTHTRTHTRTRTRTHTCKYAHVRTHTGTCVRSHTHTHTYTHPYTHIRTHTRTHTQNLLILVNTPASFAVAMTLTQHTDIGYAILTQISIGRPESPSTLRKLFYATLDLEKWMNDTVVR